MNQSTSTVILAQETDALPATMNDHIIDSSNIPPNWGPMQRLVFRFVFAYFVLYNLPFPFGVIPATQQISVLYANLWNVVVTAVSTRVFHTEITVLPNGSGDTTYNYIQVFCFLIVAVVIAAVWTLLDRRRTGYPQLHRALRVYVRYSLATTMITYGAVKVIKSQFPNPTLDRLIQPFGDASPMGILWTFMGASESYNIFTGAGEILGGLLLTTRRTTLLGAIVSLGVLGHVAMLNFSYDVPVKLFSLHLLAMVTYLIAPDLGRIATMFLMNRGADAVEIHPLLGRKWLDRTAIVARTLLVAAYLGLALLDAYEGRKLFGDLSPRSPLYGIWQVDEFEVDGKVRPPLVTDAERWRRVVFDHPTMLAVQLMSDRRIRYMLNLDPSAKTMVLTKRDDPAWKVELTYQEPEPGLIALEGTIDRQKIRAKLRRTDNPDFLLINRGFHWINEYPFNR
jgi:hypothetical protein